MIQIAPAETKGLHIDLDSTVAAQFGRQIRKVIEETLTGFGLEDADVKAVDKGARDCTIRARVTAAATVHPSADRRCHSPAQDPIRAARRQPRPARSPAPDMLSLTSWFHVPPHSVNFLYATHYSMLSPAVPVFLRAFCVYFLHLERCYGKIK